MKKIKAIFLILILPFVAISQQTPVIPDKTNSSVNDYADILSDIQENQLISYIKDVEKKSSIQFCIVTTNDVEKGYPIEDFANELFNKWGIGQAGINNGCLILVFPNNRQSRVEVGYDLEKTLTDGYTRVKQSELLNPYFKKGDYYTGLKTLVEDFSNKLNPEFQLQQQAFFAKQQKERDQALSTFFDYLISIVGCLLIITLMVVLYKISEKKRRIIEEAEKDRLLEIKMKEERILNEYKAMVKEAKELTSACSEEYEQHIRQITELSETNFLNSKEILSKLQDLKSKVIELGSLKEIEVKPNYITLHEQFTELTKTLYIRKKQKKEAEFIGVRIQTLEKEHSKRLKDTFEIINNIKIYSASVWETGKKNDSFDISLVQGNNFKLKAEMLFEESKTGWAEITKYIENNEYEQAFEYSKKIGLLLKQYDDLLKFVYVKLEEIKFCDDYLNTNKTKINDIINRISLKSMDSMVKNSTRKAFKDYYVTINQHLVFPSSTAIGNNPIADKLKLETFLNALKKHEEAIDLDVFKYKEEVKREERRKREAEEEERRKSSYTISSLDTASSFDGGSSFNNDTSFGGGSSGGGGSNNDW